MILLYPWDLFPPKSYFLNLRQLMMIATQAKVTTIIVMTNAAVPVMTNVTMLFAAGLSLMSILSLVLGVLSGLGLWPIFEPSSVLRWPVVSVVLAGTLPGDCTVAWWVETVGSWESGTCGLGEVLVVNVGGLSEAIEVYRKKMHTLKV